MATLPRQTVTGSLGLDLLILAGLLAWQLGTAEDLPVYYTVTPARVSVAAVAPDGTRTVLETPPSFARVSHSPWRISRRIEAFADTDAGRSLGPPGARLEWTIHHSKDSLRLDQTETFETPGR